MVSMGKATVQKHPALGATLHPFICYRCKAGAWFASLLPACRPEGPPSPSEQTPSSSPTPIATTLTYWFSASSLW
jgi:hypothetical protein